MAKQLEGATSMLSDSTKAHIKEASDNTVNATFGAVRGSIPGVVTAVKSGVESISESVEAVKGLNDDMKGRTLKEKASVVKEFAQTSMQSTADSVMEKPGEMIGNAKEIIAVGSGQKSVRDAIDEAAKERREKREEMQRKDEERQKSADERVGKKKGKVSDTGLKMAGEHGKLVKYAMRDELIAEAAKRGASQEDIDNIAESAAQQAHSRADGLSDDFDRIAAKYPVVKETYDKGMAVNNVLDGPALQDGFDAKVSL